MHRTHTCGELRIEHNGQHVTLSGWVQRTRDKGGMLWIDLRDRYGITQLYFEEGKTASHILDVARSLGREFVVKATGTVIERFAKNPNMPTGDIELQVTELEILNGSKTPPFTIEDVSDGGDDLRMQWRYLDLRRNPLKNNLMLRHRIGIETRKYLDSLAFMEVETPYLNQEHTGRSARLCCALANECRPILRTSSIASNIQTNINGSRLRPLLSDCTLLSR
jgi:aspartyl-tRNA synthetase